jgi:hypothetical protein
MRGNNFQNTLRQVWKILELMASEDGTDDKRARF